MTALAEHEFRRPLRVHRLVVGVAVGIAFAALTGVWASHLVSPSEDSKAAPSRVVEAGPARLAMPADWQPMAPDERSPGLDSEQLAVLSRSSELSTMAVVTFGSADERSLIPRGLAGLVDATRSRPQVTSLAGRPAWKYRGLKARRWNLSMDVTVLPTTAGMLALACASPSDAGPDCASSVTSVSLRGIEALEPSPTVALAVQLPAMLAPLDQARVDSRAALGQARTPEAQAVALHRLAGLHQAAADRLRKAFGTAATPLAARLEDVASAYAALGTAASDGSAARFAAARQDVRAAEDALGSAIDRVRAAGARATATSRPPSPAAPPTDPGRPLFGPALLAVLLLLVSCAVGFAVSGPLAHAIARARA